MIVVKAVKINSNTFNVKVTEENNIIIKSLLEKERKRIIDKLKNYKTAGFINSIFRPKNKALQKELDELVVKKIIIKNSINQINKIFK